MIARSLTRLAVAFALAGCALPGCTVVRIQEASSGKVEVERHFGVLSVGLKPESDAVIESTTVGFVNTYDGMAIGFHSATVAALGAAKCRVVLWIRTDAQLKELQDLLRERADVCVFNPDEDLRRKR